MFLLNDCHCSVFTFRGGTFHESKPQSRHRMMFYFPYISTCHCLHPGRSPPGFPRRPGGGGGTPGANCRSFPGWSPSPAIPERHTRYTALRWRPRRHRAPLEEEERQREREENKGHGWGNWATCCKTAAEKTVPLSPQDQRRQLRSALRVLPNAPSGIQCAMCIADIGRGGKQGLFCLCSVCLHYWILIASSRDRKRDPRRGLYFIVNCRLMRLKSWGKCALLLTALRWTFCNTMAGLVQFWVV